MTDMQPLPHDRDCPQASLVLRRSNDEGVELRQVVLFFGDGTVSVASGGWW
jgi:hypothetical protein